MLRISFVTMILFFAFCLTSEANDITGKWNLPNHNATVEIFTENGKYFARIISVDHDESELGLYDRHNPDEDKRDRPVEGLLIITDMERDGNRWTGGDIYDPQTGRTYNCRITRESNNEITVRG